MGNIAGIFALALLFQTQGCDLNQMAGQGPDQIRTQAEGELRSYFPRARVWVSGEQEAIVGLTCITNLGRPVIEQMIPVLDKTAGVQELKKWRKYDGFRGIAELFGAKFTTYRYFALGFDKSMIWFDADSNRYDVLPAEQVQGYEDQYRQECELSPRSDSAQSRTTEAYIWLGLFSVTAEFSNGTTRTFETTDTLGLYSEPDFNLVRDEEIEHRKQLMRTFMEAKNTKVISVQLRSVSKISWEPSP